MKIREFQAKIVPNFRAAWITQAAIYEEMEDAEMEAELIVDGDSARLTRLSDRISGKIVKVIAFKFYGQIYYTEKIDNFYDFPATLFEEIK